MIAEMDELTEARATVEALRIKLQAAEQELSEWMDNRHLGGLPAKSLDLASGRLIDATAIDTRSFEIRENMLRSNCEGARVRLAEAESKLRDIRLTQLEGVKVRVQLFDCVTGKGDELISSALVSGVVFGALGPWAGIRLDQPTVFQGRSVHEVFCRKARLLCSD